MDIDATKKQLQQLVDFVNSQSPDKRVKFHQQDKIKKHMSIKKGKRIDGRLCIQPTSNGYDIALSGKSLEKEMYGFMRDLCQSECSGYKQPNKKIGKLDFPFWRVHGG